MIELETVNTKTETFIKGTYNGIEIISRKSDGFVNATKMVKKLKGTSDAQFRRFLRKNQGWNEYYDAFCEKMSSDHKVQAQKFIETCSTQYPNAYKGTYVHPKLINYIAMWASPQYALYVSDIMDSINDKVHEKLEEKGLEDTPTNAIEALNEVVEPLFNVRANESRNAQCWGVRDSPYKLDQWEREDFTRELKEKNEELMKKEMELKELQKYVDSLRLNVSVLNKLLEQ